MPFLHTNRRLIFILSSFFSLYTLFSTRFSFSLPQISSIVVVLQAFSCALVGKRKSSLPFGSWNQFRKYLVPTTILPKPLIRRHVGSYGRNRANAFAFQRLSNATRKYLPPKDTKGDTNKMKREQTFNFYYKRTCFFIGIFSVLKISFASM